MPESVLTFVQGNESVSQPVRSCSFIIIISQGDTPTRFACQSRHDLRPHCSQVNNSIFPNASVKGQFRILESISITFQVGIIHLS